MQDTINTINIPLLLAKTDAFISTMYAVRGDFNLIPQKEHIATCINYSDLVEMKEEFIEELVHTVIDFVYSKNEQHEIQEGFCKKRTVAAAASKLAKRAHDKFRSRDKKGSAGTLQGQFLELLLFNLLQHYFKAAPLIRKMPITTNTEVERHGADAIHVAQKDDNYIIYVGEAKAYDPKNVIGLKSALKKAVEDVVDKHYKLTRKEIDLHIVEKHLTPELQKLAEEYIEGTLEDVEVHIVCIVAYDIKKTPQGMNRKEILMDVINSVTEETIGLSQTKTFQAIPRNVLPRLNYIIFPIHEMETLIDLFATELGA